MHQTHDCSNAEGIDGKSEGKQQNFRERQSSLDLGGHGLGPLAPPAINSHLSESQTTREVRNRQQSRLWFEAGSIIRLGVRNFSARLSLP